MDLDAAREQQGSKWGWARTGALLLFVLSGVLLLASLSASKAQRADARGYQPTTIQQI